PYIVACHDLVFSQFRVESDRRLTSKGSITNPRNKLCPTSLEPWPDFLGQPRSKWLGYDVRMLPTRLGLSRAKTSWPVWERVFHGDRSLTRSRSNIFMHNGVENRSRSSGRGTTQACPS
ncbi:hypothetical protein CEP52_017557, partial [Fusarium oligoseptatum]